QPGAAPVAQKPGGCPTVSLKADLGPPRSSVGPAASATRAASPGDLGFPVRRARPLSTPIPRALDGDHILLLTTLQRRGKLRREQIYYVSCIVHVTLRSSPR